MRFLPLLAAATSLAAVPAFSQNLLSNGDFEASGDIGFGDHLSFDIPAWESGGDWFGDFVAWNSGNLVQVDGPGGGDYGIQGPESDADGGPAGSTMHYVDDAGGGINMLLWQYFTPECSGSIQGSAAFSNRANRSVPVALGIVGPISNPLTAPVRGEYFPEEGAVVQDFIAFSTAFNAVSTYEMLPSAPSRTHTWVILPTNSASVVAGQTYAFAARVSGDGNVDNASVTFVSTDDCGPEANIGEVMIPDLAPFVPPVAPLVPSDISLTKSCEALEANVRNGVLGQTWSCSVDVTVPQAPFAGSLTVNDLLTLPATVTGEILSSSAQSGNFDCSAVSSCTIDGAQFDPTGTETLLFEVFVTSETAERSESLQNCTSGSYVLNDSTVSVPGNCVQASWSGRHDVVKTCDPVVATDSGVMSLTCQITVTGSNLPANGYVSLIDVFAAQPPAVATVVGPMTTITSAQPWSCQDIANTGGTGTMGVCQLSTLDLFNAGGSSVIDMTFDFTTDQAPTQVMNCPILSIEDTLMPGDQRSASGTMRNPDGTGWPAGLPDGCVFIDVPAPTPPLPVLEDAYTWKTCDAPRAGQVAGVNGFLWDCEVNVVLNPAPFDGSFTLTENASQITNGTASFVSASRPCTGIGTDVLQCQIDGATASSAESMSVQMFATATNANRSILWTNCVSGVSAGTGRQIETGDYCVQTEIKPGDTPRVPVIDVTKTCEAIGERQILSQTMWTQQMRCALTVTTNGVPFTAPLWLTEELSYGPNSMNGTLATLSSTDPWQCTQAPYTAPGQPQTNLPVCAISGAQFPHAAGSSTVFVDFVLYGGPASISGAENCVGVTLGDAPVTDIGAAQASDCVEILPAPVVLDPELSIIKTCEPAVQGTPGAWHVACAITVSGTNLPGGELVQVRDEVTSSTTQSVWQGAFTPSASWNLSCGGYGVANGIGSACTLTTDFITAQGGSVTIPYSADFTGPAGRPVDGPRAQNCVYADLSSPGLHAPAGANNRQCVPILFNHSPLDPILNDPAVVVDPTGPIVAPGGTTGSVANPVIVDPVDPSDPVFGGNIGALGGGGLVVPPTPQIEVSKTCDPIVVVAGAQTSQMRCTISVTARNLTSTNSLHLIDQLGYSPWAANDPVVPIVGPFSNVTGADGWDCNDYPYGLAHGAGICSVSGDVMNAAGGTMTFEWTAELGPLAAGRTLRNCATVRLDSLSNYVDALSACAEIDVLHEPEALPTAAELLLTPEQIGSCHADRDRQVYDCVVGVRIENTDTQPYSGPIALLETFGAPGINAAHLVSGEGAACAGPVDNAVTCSIPQVSWEPRNVYRIDLSLVVPGRPNGGQLQVCAQLGAPDNQRQRVAMVQNSLNQRGYDAGPVDGFTGRRTYGALAQVQAQLGVPLSRELEPALLSALGMAPATEPACTQLSLPRMPAPPLQCNRATTVAQGESCACRYDGMTRRNATSCSCPRGTELVGGEGCIRVAAPAPVPTPRPTPPRDTPDEPCRSGLTLNGACVSLGGPLLETLIPGLRGSE
ncbi:hypothetical protein JI664_10830 [Rhodobacter sp. NTK016B]|uniref:peptidoglycan-binding domain-containing protein n=1 Tax=Rhodobacter sp. NTK016B TaxID=2759676 RepID=UPI001A903C92|nr:peptidoglycan-binding domain-containing protein [Rhodobacter sp. NTK016B]MBN8292460.1 hypothetical protein [Rhodobacter sp. NTK016B]